MKYSTLSLVLSITIVPVFVNGQTQDLTTVNHSHSKTKLSQAQISRLINEVMTTGTDGKYGENIAPVIGLPHAMATKSRGIVLHRDDSKLEGRAFRLVVDEINESTTPAKTSPFCFYLEKIKDTALVSRTDYFKVSLAGNLEKSVHSEFKKDENGNVIAGSASNSEQDIDSSEIKIAFKTEISYWVNDWLKKQGKGPGKE